jgi:hypothetical protein
MKIFKKSVPVFVCAIGLVALMSSCVKSSMNNTPPPPVAALMFVQAAPDQAPLDLLLGTVRVNQAPINYGENSPYFNVNPGSFRAAFYTDATQQVILLDTVHFSQNTAYSLFLANKPGHTETVLLTDTLNKPAAGNAAIRFVNLSPDAPAVDLAVQGGAVLVANKSYKGHSSFAPIAGNPGYTFEVRQAGTNTVLATLSNVTLTGGGLYTVWFHGLAAGTAAGDKLSAGIINNAYFF